MPQLNQGTDHMQITIVEKEIHEAIEGYVRSLIEVKEGSRIDIQLRATRGQEGATAMIDIVSEDTPVRAQEKPTPLPTPTPAPTTTEPAPEAAPVVKRRGRPPGSTNKDKSLNIAEKIEEAKAPEAAETTEAEDASEEEAARAADAIDLNAPVEEDTETETEAEPTAVEVTDEATAESTEVAEAEPAPRQSLFSNLNKPKN